jgi:hypothetical protein
MTAIIQVFPGDQLAACRQRSDMHDRPASILPISVVLTATTW